MNGIFTVNKDKAKKARGHDAWRVEGKINGRRIRVYYPTEQIAKEQARVRNLELANHGHKTADIPAPLRIVAIAAADKLGVLGGDIANHFAKAIDEYLHRHDLRGRSVTVAAAWAKYKLHEERRVAGKRLRPISFETTKKVVSDFNEAFGTRLVYDLGTQRITEWLEALTREDRQPASTSSKETYRLGLSGFFSFCVKQNWIAEHPIKSKIPAFREKEDKRPGIFTAEQAARLLEAADSEVLPVIAIGLFAGLRPTEIWRLNWEDVLWAKNEIDVQPSTSKTARYRFVPMPENLQLWLAPYRGRTGRICPDSHRTLRRGILQAAKSAGIANWPKDGLRHSYGSHHLALTDNAPLTAARMGHEGTTILFQHYNNRRSKEEAEAYFGIRPLDSDKISVLAAA